MAPTKPQTNGQSNGQTNGQTNGNINGDNAPPAPLSNKAVQDLVQSLQQLLEGHTAKAIVATIEESKRVSKENEELNITLTKTFETIAKVQQDSKDTRARSDKVVNQLGQANKDKEDMTAKYAKAQTDLDELRAELKKALDETTRLRAEVTEGKAMEEELRKTIEGRKELETRLAKMTKSDTFFRGLAIKPVATIAGVDQSLSALFKSAYHLANQFLGQNMDASLFSKKDWEQFAKQSELAGIPVVPSNSLMAKQMRVAACLGKFASTATREIFQAVYLTNSAGDIDDLLDDLEEERVDSAEYLRRCLIKANSRRLEQNADEHVQTASGDLFKYFQELVPEEHRPQLAQAVDAWCRNACEAWKKIQLLNCRVVSDIWWETPGSISIWEPLYRITNQKPAPKAGNDEQDASGPRTPADNELNTTLQGSEIASVVWPCFYTALEQPVNGKYSVLTNGMVVTTTEADHARQEKSTMAMLGEHRSMRSHRRRNISSTSQSKSQELVGGLV